MQASFAEALEKILEEFADNWRKVYEELEKLRQRIPAARNELFGQTSETDAPLMAAEDQAA